MRTLGKRRERFSISAPTTPPPGTGRSNSEARAAHWMFAATRVASLSTWPRCASRSQGLMHLTAPLKWRSGTLKPIGADSPQRLTGLRVTPFRYCATGLMAKERFDSIVLDPPAFAKTQRAVEGALRGYKELNLRALHMIRPGGLLVTCSCSHHVGWKDLVGVVASAAADAHRRVRLLERQGRIARSSSCAELAGDRVPQMPGARGGVSGPSIQAPVA